MHNKVGRPINYKLNALRLNSIFLYFFLSQSIFPLIYFYQTPEISNAIHTKKAVWMHIIGVIWSVIGYFTAKFAYSSKEEQQEEQIKDKQYSFSNAFYICSYFLIIIGTIEAILQVVLLVSPMEYISQLFSRNFETEIRVAYLLPAEEGGLPGIVKMFSFAPLSIYLMSFGLINFLCLDIADMQKLKQLNKIALLGTVIKVFFSLDNLTIMAILLANIFTAVQKDHTKKIKFFISVAIIFLLANFISSKRLEGFGFVEVVLLYFKSALVYFQLMIDTCTGYTYGFSTILAPLNLIFRFCHLPIPDFALNSYYAWEWNPAQYFLSYAFQDFGYLYFVPFYIVGILLFVLDIRVSKQNIYSSATYFVVLYGVVSFVVVPAIRGIEFWFALLLPLALLNRFTQVINQEE